MVPTPGSIRGRKISAVRGRWTMKRSRRRGVWIPRRGVEHSAGEDALL